jgi:hypothetical protein
VVLGLRDSLDGFPVRAKVRVKQATHQLIRPSGGWQSDDNDLLAGEAVSGGLFATGLCLWHRVRQCNTGSTRYHLLSVNNCGSKG